jgi:hypothetical protein
MRGHAWILERPAFVFSIMLLREQIRLVRGHLGIKTGFAVLQY